MNAVALRKADPTDLDRLLPLVAAYHDFEGIALAPDQRRNALARLLDDPGLGAVWRIYDADRLVGYAAVCFGYSIEFGGRDAFVDELFIVAEARGRGIGGAALEQIKAAARESGIVALHLEVDRTNDVARRLYGRHGFAARDTFHLMTARLRR